MAALKPGPAGPEVTPYQVQAREQALREKPPTASDRAFPRLVLGEAQHPKVFGPIAGPALSFEDRLALCEAIVVDPGNAIIPPRFLDWRKTKAAHDLGDGRFAVVLTNDFVIAVGPEAPASEAEAEGDEPAADVETKGKKGRKS